LSDIGKGDIHMARKHITLGYTYSNIADAALRSTRYGKRRPIIMYLLAAADHRYMAACKMITGDTLDFVKVADHIRISRDSIRKAREYRLEIQAVAPAAPADAAWADAARAAACT
jgi:hypothetical protein